MKRLLTKCPVATAAFNFSHNFRSNLLVLLGIDTDSAAGFRHTINVKFDTSSVTADISFFLSIALQYSTVYTTGSSRLPHTIKSELEKPL